MIEPLKNIENSKLNTLVSQISVIDYNDRTENLFFEKYLIYLIKDYFIPNYFLDLEMQDPNYL